MNAKSLVYNLDLDIWGVYSNVKAGAMSVWSEKDDAGEIYIGTSDPDAPKVCRFYSGITDDGSAIDYVDERAPLDFGLPEMDKQFIGIYLALGSGTGTLTLLWNVDAGARRGTIVIPFQSGILWNAVKWGRSVWSKSKSTQRFTRLPQECYGKQLMLTFEAETESSNFGIDGFTVLWQSKERL